MKQSEKQSKHSLYFRLGSLVKRAARLVRTREDDLAYWERRAKENGARAVLNLGHPEHELNDVTERQEREIFPHFRARLTGAERLTLDFGCGPGRFTRQLADITGGKVIGVDPVATLLDLAPRKECVSYEPLRGSVIPLASASVDAVWCCLVLGGIKDKNLSGVADELDRILIAGGLLFLIENTSDKPNAEHWAFRSVSKYCSLFPSARLSHLHDYYDLGERISIIAGRKLDPPAARQRR